MDSTRWFRWNRLQCSGEGTELYNRYGFSATLVGGSLWVLGGLRMKNHLSVLDIKTLSWKSYLVGDVAKPSAWHSATLFEDKLLVFGTVMAITTNINEMYALDVVTMDYSLVPTFNKPAMPVWHPCNTAELYARGNKLVVLMAQLGNQGPPQFRLLDLATWNWEAPKTRGYVIQASGTPAVESCISGSRFWVYDTVPQESRQSRIFFVDLDGPEKYVWTELRCGRSVYRFGTSLNYMGNGRLIIYGGSAGRGKNSNEIRVVEQVNSTEASLHDVRNQTESPKYGFSGDAPYPRYFFKVLNVQDNLFMLGGTYNDRSDLYVLSPS